MADARYRGELEKQKRASTGQLLFRCARLLNDSALDRVRRRTGMAKLRAAHTSLLPHLGFDGTRLTDLAERLGVSKQATFQLVEELEAFGMVEKCDDPRDGRAKLIRFSQSGERALLEGLRVLRELELELAAAIGARRFAALHDALTQLLPVLEADRVPNTTPGKPSAAQRKSGKRGASRSERNASRLKP